jgi:hypothetical protein
MPEQLRLQGWACRHLGSPFYGDLLDLTADDFEAGGVVHALLAAHEHEGSDAAYPIRMLGGVHRLVLAGGAPDLAPRFPTTGGDGDATAAWPAFRALLESRPAMLVDALARPPQTNEVGRTASLAAGLAVVAQRFGLPIRLLEIGTSAALNLRLDRYWYEQGGASWGDRASAVRFVDLWLPDAPPFDASTRIVERRGCDRNPIDATNDPEAGLTLLSYVWPGQDARFEALRAALAIAATTPVDVDRADAAEWVPAQLARAHDGIATVVMHSIFWQYLDDARRDAIAEALAAAGAHATSHAPVAYLRLEPNENSHWTELRLTGWPGGDEELLATAGFHAGPVRWPAPSGAETGEE